MNYHQEFKNLAGLIQSTLSQTRTWAEEKAYSLMSETHGWTPAETLQKIEESRQQAIDELRREHDSLN